MKNIYNSTMFHLEVLVLIAGVGVLISKPIGSIVSQEFGIDEKLSQPIIAGIIIGSLAGF